MAGQRGVPGVLIEKLSREAAQLEDCVRVRGWAEIGGRCFVGGVAPMKGTWAFGGPSLK